MNRRWQPLLAGIMLGILPFGMMAGSGGGLVIVGGALLLGMAMFRQISANARPLVPGSSWTPSSPLRFVAAEVRPPASRFDIACALGRVEAGQLFPSSLAFATGIGFSLLNVILFGVAWSRDDDGQTARFIGDFAFMAYPLAGMTIVAVHRARTRARRDNVEEIFTACPVDDEVRNAGHVAAVWVPAAAAAVMVGALLLGHTLRAELHWGPFGARQFADIAAAIILVVGAGALGVVLARWAPWPIVPPVAIIAIGLVSIRFADTRGGDAGGLPQLSLVTVFDDVDIRFTAPHWEAHHLWVIALVLTTLILALWRREWRVPMSVALAISVMVGVTAATAATRPTADSDVERIVSLIVEPELHQECEDIGVVICTYPGDESLRDASRPHVEAVLGAVPPGVVVDERIIRQATMLDPTGLDDAVVAQVSDRRCRRDVLPVDLISPEAVRYWLALSLTGIAAELDHADIVDLSGQARGVIAIWLATRDMPVESAVERMASTSERVEHGEEWYPSRPWPDVSVAGPTPVTWALTDLDLARQLIRSNDEVTATIHHNWERLLDPLTTTDEAAELLGLESVGPPSGITPVIREC